MHRAYAEWLDRRSYKTGIGKGRDFAADPDALELRFRIDWNR